MGASFHRLDICRSRMLSSAFTPTNSVIINSLSLFPFGNGDLHKLLEELKEAILTLNRATIMIAPSTKNTVEITKRPSSYASRTLIPSGPLV